MDVPVFVSKLISGEDFNDLVFNALVNFGKDCEGDSLPDRRIKKNIMSEYENIMDVLCSYDNYMDTSSSDAASE